MGNVALEIPGSRETNIRKETWEKREGRCDIPKTAIGHQAATGRKGAANPFSVGLFQL
jgi:hypothetical protein